MRKTLWIALLVLAIAGSHAHALPAAAGQHAPPPPHPQGYLGIGFSELTQDQLSAMHLPGIHGVEVVMVDHDGPAGKAGLRPKDVIVMVNGQPVSNADVMHRLIHDAGAGSTITMVVMRDGHSLNLTAQLQDKGDVERHALQMLTVPEPMPPADNAPAVPFGESLVAPPDPPASSKNGFLSSMLHTTPYTGVAMQEMEPQLAAYFHAPTGMGLLVETVLANSPAATAGLRAGDIVLKADYMPLRSTADWTRYLHTTRGKTITLTVLRDKQQTTVTLTPDLKKHSLLEWPSFF